MASWAARMQAARVSASLRQGISTETSTTAGAACRSRRARTFMGRCMLDPTRAGSTPCSNSRRKPDYRRPRSAVVALVEGDRLGLWFRSLPDRGGPDDAKVLQQLEHVRGPADHARDGE